MKHLILLLVFFSSICVINAQEAEEFVFNYYVCETDNCITLQPHLGDVNEEDVDCFAWESEENISSPQQQEQEVCPTQDTKYSLFIIDSDGNIIEEITYLVTIIAGEPPAIAAPDSQSSDVKMNKANLYSCNLAETLNNFLINNDIYNGMDQKISKEFSNVANESRLPEELFTDYLNQFKLASIEWTESSATTLVNFMCVNDLNPNALSYATITSPDYTCDLPSPVSQVGWEPLRGPDFVDLTETLMNSLIIRYPFQ
ncbi:hypothetical protein FUA23_18315 [Neolewinella aurantiaca]|uniref:Uncharacterized protein n=1 Tax=Neolewinella aurantiaca TaxID=2602767 RepID=A0A5C7FS72_9BACT|nr:hypothetical protein [Neolewinella aurantiaca]TXF87545.1 hypothetical protein FUA23_18315 [Neolewinella aurantiaca]